MDQRVALISDNMALSQTVAKAAGPCTQDSCVSYGVHVYLPANAGTKLYCLANTGTMCVSSLYKTVL